MSLFANRFPDYLQDFAAYTGLILCLVFGVLFLFWVIHKHDWKLGRIWYVACIIFVAAIYCVWRGSTGLAIKESAFNASNNFISVNMERANLFTFSSPRTLPDERLLTGYVFYVTPIYITNNQKIPATIEMTATLECEGHKSRNMVAEKDSSFSRWFQIKYETQGDPDGPPIVFSPLKLEPYETKQVQTAFTAYIFDRPLDFKKAELTLKFKDIASGQNIEMPWAAGIPGRNDVTR